MSTQTNIADYDSDESSDSSSGSNEELKNIDVGHPDDPNTIDETEVCSNCGRSISKRSQALLQDNACLFCEGEDDE